MNRYPCQYLQNLFTLIALAVGGNLVSLAGELEGSPPTVILERLEASQQLIIWQTFSDQRRSDRTREATIRVEPAGIATVDERGLVRPLGNAMATLLITVGDQQKSIPVGTCVLSAA